MSKCSACGHTYIPGTLFCSECGLALQDESGRSVDQSAMPWQAVHVLVSGSRQQWRLPLNGPLWIGRADPERGYWPQIDVTEEGGAELGVSRRHAVIDVTDRGPVLIDKSSVNGTWLEDEPLSPQQPYVLPPVARVRFARLQARLILE